ncbi:MAG: ABC transporter permease subunit [Planctomycetota bacterium]
MWNYIAKRLLLTIPTLLGITVITFLLIRLAPGDPSRMESNEGFLTDTTANDTAVIQQNRKIFGLDKPVLINLDVKDRRRSVLSLWEEMVRLVETQRALIEIDARATAPGRSLRALQDKIKKKKEELLGFERRLIPYLVPLAVSQDHTHFPLLSELLVNGAGLEAAADREALSAWWEENRHTFSDAWIRETLSALETCPEEEVAERSRSIHSASGGLALPLAVERIEALGEGLARKRLVALVAPYAGYTWKLMPQSKDSRYATALAFIRKWWQMDNLSFREISEAERLVKTFTDAQYSMWLGRILCLDFGESYIDHRPVMEKVWEAFKVTLSFQVIVLFLVYLISVPIGVYSAVRQGSLADRCITIVLFMLYSLPNFWVAYLLILFLGGGQFLDIFPIQGLNSDGAESLAFWPWLLDRLWHMCLPLVCMTYVLLAGISRYTRTGMLEVIRHDYVRTARAKGLSEFAVISRHVLRNGIIPIITVLGGSVPMLISGSVVVEFIFGIHGMGNLGFTAMLQRDYPTIMAITFFSAILVLVGFLISDLLYAVMDPRIRFEESRTS